MIRAGLILGAALAAPVQAQDAQDTLRLLLEQGTQAVTFADSFRDAVDVAQIAPLIDTMTAQIGPIQDITVRDGSWRIRSAGWVVRGTIALDAQGRIAGLFFQPAVPTSLDLETATDAFAALGETVAWLVIRDGDTLSARDADRAFPVASAFKLGVLAAMRDAEAEGTLSRDTVVTLKDAHRSLPDSGMAAWPVGTPVPLGSAAVMMMRTSDNTATDLVMHTVGRDRVAARLGRAFVPTTREVFALAADPDLGADYLSAAPSAGAGMAADAARARPAQIGDAGPFAWPLPLTTLCDLAQEVQGDPATSAGPVPAEDWETVTFKGGSVPGVLNLTAAQTDAEGVSHCVAVTVIDPDAQEPATVSAFLAVLETLKEGGG